ncbi:hypothetical protein AAG906_038826 [Vitis piasezkii]
MVRRKDCLFTFKTCGNWISLLSLGLKATGGVMIVLIPRNLTTLTNHPSNPHLTYLLGVVLSQGLSFQLWPVATTLVTLLDQLHSHPTNIPLSHLLRLSVSSNLGSALALSTLSPPPHIALMSPSPVSRT